MPRGLIAFLLIEGLTGAQSVSSPADWAAVLERAQQKLSETTRRLVKYTCLETVGRTYYVAPTPEPKRGEHMMTEAPAAAECAGREFGQNQGLLLDATDRLRLEVAVSGEGEIHSWPAASRFDDRIFQMVPVGPVSSGAFGTGLIDIFANPGVHFEFTGRRMEGAREIYAYSFRVGMDASHYYVRAGTKWKPTAYGGSFDINAATAELAHIVVETDELPADAEMCRARTTTDYHYALIGDGQLLLPRKSELATLSANGDETLSLTTYSACHEYEVESSIRFDDGDVTLASMKTAARTTPAFPAGTALTLDLLNAVDARTASAGDVVVARLAEPVRAPNSKEILAPAGAIAYGRIQADLHKIRNSNYMVMIRFETLVAGESTWALALKPEREMKTEQKRNAKELRTRGGEIALPPPSQRDESGSWFIVSGKQVCAARTDSCVRYEIPRGARLKWISLRQ